MLKHINDYNFTNKRVIVRCDFNVPIEGDKVKDNFKIEKTLPTIRFLQDRGAKIILISHLSESSKNGTNSLKPVKKELEKLLGGSIVFSKKVLGFKVRKMVWGLKAGKILLLENLRTEKGEKKNNLKFAKKLSKLADFYVNEAFSVCHRKHASISLLPKLLPNSIGFEFEKEIKFLSQVSQSFQSSQGPLCVIIGGVKIDSKIKVVKKFLEKADHLILGSYIANNILRVKGVCVGLPWPSKEIVDVIKEIDLTSRKIHLPVDVLVSPDETGELYIRETGTALARKDERIFDIGKSSIENFSKIIKESKTIFWSGSMGLFENEKFSEGTRQIAMSIAKNEKALKIIGGGDTIHAVRKFGLLNGFSFVSIGGGAMLEFLSGEELPGLRALSFYDN